MIGSVDLSPAHRVIVERILAEQVPQCEVRAFGSRAAWTAKDSSDLDLAVVGKEPLDWRTLARLKEAFEESRLPMRVDVLDWHAISESFRNVIERGYVIVQEGAKQSTASKWRKTTLGTVTDFISGGTPSKSRQDYWGGSIPWVSAKDMKRFQLHETGDKVTNAGVANGTRIVPANTVMMLVRGMTLLNDVPICIARRPMTFNQDVKALRPKPGVAEEFLPYLVIGNKDRLLGLVDLAGHGTGRLNTDEVKALDIDLPPLSEQRAIAHVLGTLDDKIELNRRMNETLEEMARALFKSWFVDFEPVRAKAALKQHALGNRAGPGAAPSGNSAAPAGEWTVDRARVYLDAMDPPVVDLFPDRLVDSELGEIPEGWEVKGLDDIADFTNGLALQRFPPEGDKWLPVVKIAEMRRGYSDKTGRASANIDPRYIVEDGDLLFSWSGSLELVFWAHGRGALNQHLFKVTSNKFPQWFYWGWTREHLDDFRAIAAGKATTMGHIQRHHLTDAKVVVPPAHAIASGATLIGALVDQHVGHAIQSRALAVQRDALLPELVLGKVRRGE